MKDASTVTKGIIYYTDNQLQEPIFSIVQEQIKKANLPIVSISLEPINFGTNFVLPLIPNIVTMVKQITKGLEESSSTYIFFCEHDVLYPTSHFEFTPQRSDIFYYNANVWRWNYPTSRVINYDRLICLSGMCVNRTFALNHYKRRLATILKMGWDLDTRRHEPDWARKWGYEPGTKKIRRGGFSDDDFETWKSEIPIIDIRHSKTFSPPKVTLESFRHLPTNWQETTINKIDGWNLKQMFNLSFDMIL
jgi:hypothetical protein